MPFAGNLKGRIECLINNGTNSNNIQNVFKTIYDVMLADTAAFEEIARYNGTGGSPGTDYHDGSSPFGPNAWFTFRWKTVTASGIVRPNIYLNFHYLPDGTSFATEATVQNKVHNATSVGAEALIGVAYGFDSGNSGGTTDIFKFTGTLGSQVRAAPRWAATSGSLLVFPRSNSTTPGGTGTAGSHQTSKENMAKALWQASTALSSRFHILYDDMNLIFLYANENSTRYRGHYIGAYVPPTGMTVTHPVVGIPFDTDWPLTTATTVASVTGSSAQTCGGIALRDVTAGTRNFYLDRLQKLTDPSNVDANLHPNKLNVTAEFDGTPIFLTASETTNYYGHAGSLDWLREVYGVASHDTSSNKKRAFFGNTSVGSVKLSVPWDGATVPGTGLTRAGVSFSRTSD